MLVTEFSIIVKVHSELSILYALLTNMPMSSVSPKTSLAQSIEKSGLTLSIHLIALRPNLKQLIGRELSMLPQVSVLCLKLM